MFTTPITPAQLKEEIEETGIDYLRQMACLLDRENMAQYKGTAWLKDRIRVAPSIGARGLADFFDLSAPRFAYRVYLGAAGDSFANVLRIGTLCNSLSNYSTRALEIHDAAKRGWKPVADQESLAERFRKNRCVGDCVLRVPRCDEGFTTVEAELGRAYGEGTDLYGIPFAHTLRLSGMCAQAVCFMATTLLHRHSRGVYSVSEITYLAQAPKVERQTWGDVEKEEVLVHGLNHDQIRQYFEAVDLRADVQSPWWGNFRIKEVSLEGLYRTCLESYLRSGFPIILPVDLGRMWGQNYTPAAAPGAKAAVASTEELPPEPVDILAVNGYREVAGGETKAAFREKRHAVLAVGFNEAGTILLNDPSNFPFLKATLEEIHLARPYRKAWLETLTAPPVFPRSDEKPPVSPLDEPYRFSPIVPLAVRLPLLRTSHQQAENGEKSLFELYLAAAVAFPGKLDRRVFGRFLLGRCAADGARVHGFLSQYLPGRDEAGNHESAGQLLDYLTTRLGDRWVWFQAWSERGLLMVWDAEGTTRIADRWRKHLIGFYQFSQPPGSSAVEFGPVFEPHETRGVCAPRAVAPDARAGLVKSLRLPAAATPAIISSFAANGLRHWLSPKRSWPEGAACDLYCFMQGDSALLGFQLWNTVREFASRWRVWKGFFSNLFRRLGLRFYGRKPEKWKFQPLLPPYPYARPRVSILRRMAALAPSAPSARVAGRKVARRLRRLFTQSGRSPEIVAMSTFLPELCAEDEGKRLTAVAALRFLMHLAVELNPGRCAQSRFTIEIVAGGLTCGLWPAGKNWTAARAGETYMANPEPDGPSQGEPQDFFVMNVRSLKAAQGQLVQSLRDLRATALETNVRLSIECEPGPLYILGSLDRLLKLCRKVDVPDLAFVGLNLDIAHWAFLKRLRPDTLALQPGDCELLRRLVQSSHLADHADGGHFGDAVPGEIHPLEAFDPWLEWLFGLENGRFTGLVSGELEACKSDRDLHALGAALGMLPALVTE